MKLKKIEQYIKIEREGATFTLKRLSDFDRFAPYLDLPILKEGEEHTRASLMEIQKKLHEIFKQNLVSFSNVTDENDNEIKDLEVLYNSLPKEILDGIVNEYYEAHNEEKKIITTK